MNDSTLLRLLAALGKTLVEFCEQERKPTRKLEVRASDQLFNDELLQFKADCLQIDLVGPGVAARAMYLTYRSWAESNSKLARTENKFGREMPKICPRDDSRGIHVYPGVRLR